VVLLLRRLLGGGGGGFVVGVHSDWSGPCVGAGSWQLGG